MRSVILAASAIVAFGIIGLAEPASAQSYSIQSCHRQVLRHSHPGIGFRYHYHTGRNCRPVTVNVKPQHCHASPQRHYHPGIGTAWHRHVGNNCRPATLRRFERRIGPACIRIGPFWYCP